MTGDLVWTKHLEQRLLQRDVSRNEVYDTIRHPDYSVRLSSAKWRLTKNFSRKQVTVIAANEKRQWIILSVWSKAPRPIPKTGEHPLTYIVRNLLTRVIKSATRALRS